jgi:hypothetical protein
VSGWIKFWKDMPNDPRVLAAAEKLAERMILANRSKMGGRDLPASEAINLCRNAVTGALATLWGYADEHIRDDDSLPLTLQTLDTIVGIEGFFELMPRDWLDKFDDGSIVLPGYCKKNSLIAKRKRTVKSNARVTRWRRAHKTNSNGVTTRHSTQCNAAGDLDQDLDSDEDQDLRRRTRNPSAAAPPTRVPRRNVSRGTDPEWMLDFKLAYPSRAGDPGWRKAVRAANERIREGHDPIEFIEGARRYAVFCEATGKLNTEFVKQASTFLGPDKPFLQSWDLPATPAETRLSQNLSAADEFMRRTEENRDSRRS